MALAVASNGTQMSSAGPNLHPFFRQNAEKVSTLHQPESQPSRVILPHVAPSPLNNETSLKQAKIRLQRSNDGDVHGMEEAETSMKRHSAVPADGDATLDKSRIDGKTVTSRNETIQDTAEPITKRRKIGLDPGTDNAAKQGTLSWVKPSNNQSRSVDVAQSPKSNHKDAGNTAQVEVAKTVKTTKLNDDTKESSKGKKMMKLRTDGRLFSPPKKVEFQDTEKKGQKVSTRKKGFVVKINYGMDEASKREIGEKIRQILSGELRNRPSESKLKSNSATVKITSATPTKKPAHPFFLGSRKEPVIGTRSSSPSRSAGKDSRNTSPRRQVRGVAPEPFTVPIFGSGASKIVSPPGSKEPIWPPEELAHVVPPDSILILRSLPRQVHFRCAARKAKESQIRMDPTEELLYNLTNLSADPRLAVHVSEDQLMFPGPIRQILPKKDLPENIVKRLSTNSLAEKLNSFDDDLSGSFPSKVTERLLRSLPEADSAFDNFRCEQQEWLVKYAPKSASEVLQPIATTTLLKSWLSGTAVHSTTVNGAVTTKKKRKALKRRKLDPELDDFIVTSEDEDTVASSVATLQPPDMSRFIFNKRTPRSEHWSPIRRFAADSLLQSRAVLISGPPGCGKTATVYAIAAELGLEVFEINAGSRRSGRDILEKVGDMTKNHLVSQGAVQSGDEAMSADERAALDPKEVRDEIASGKQSTMQSFFQKKLANKPSKPKQTKNSKAKSEPKPPPKKATKSQKQSLILIEEVDVLFEEDKQFWSTVESLIAVSKRPVIMTCNDESLLPINEVDSCSLLRLQSVAKDVAVDYLLLIAAHEGHLLDRKAVEILYTQTNQDLRASIMQLNLWCQMAINDDKGGLNWILLPQDYKNTETEIGTRRVLSENTYPSFVGMLGRNWSRSIVAADNSSQQLEDAMDAWNFDLEEDRCATVRHWTEFETLSTYDLGCDVLSALDVMQATNGRSHIHANLGSSPTMPERRCNLGFTCSPALIVDPSDGITKDKSVSFAASIQALASTILYSGERHKDAWEHDDLCQKILKRPEPLEAHCSFIQDTANTALQPLLEDVSNTAAMVDSIPYIRSIISYDNRLAQERARLTSIMSDGIQPGKRQRTTRASRAALEGGHKASTRRERWFEIDLDVPLIIETGGESWQDLAWDQYEKARKRLRWTQQAEQAESEDELAS